MNLTPLLIASTLIALAGCASVGAESTLKYDGKVDGTHSDTFKCDDQGTIDGSGNIPDGEVVITLTDSAGKQLFQQTFTGSFTLAEKTVSGASGTWSMSASRTSDDVVGDQFSGKYTFDVNC